MAICNSTMADTHCRFRSEPRPRPSSILTLLLSGVVEKVTGNLTLHTLSWIICLVRAFLLLRDRSLD